MCVLLFCGGVLQSDCFVTSLLFAVCCGGEEKVCDCDALTWCRDLSITML